MLADDFWTHASSFFHIESWLQQVDAIFKPLIGKLAQRNL